MNCLVTISISLLLQILVVVVCDELFVIPLLETLTVSNVGGKVEEKKKPLLPEDCGSVRPTWRVEVNVRTTELFEFPFYVDFIYENVNSSSPRIHCGGTLINNRFVVTAASCIRNKPEIVAVRLGEHDLDTNPDCYPEINNKIVCAPPYAEFSVTKSDVLVHEEYEGNSTYDERWKYDIALIRLPEEVKFTDAVEPVCLPIKPHYRNQGNLTLIGFPKMYDSSSRSNALLSLSIPHAGCRVEGNFLCAAGTNRKRHCRGYSGSAILYIIVENFVLRWVLAAIVPYGMDICDLKGVPKVFPRMEMYNEWILKNIKIN